MDYVNTINRDILLELYSKKIYLEGNILKVVTPDPNDLEFIAYLDFCKNRDIEMRRKRLTVAQTVQQKTADLQTANDNNTKLLNQLHLALEQAKQAELIAITEKETAETAKQSAILDLEYLQKKRQFELTGIIVNIALYVIVGVGILSSLMFAIAMATGHDSTIIENTWSNLFGILLTNSFSIVGTIMGIRYATKSNVSSSSDNNVQPLPRNFKEPADMG